MTPESLIQLIRLANFHKITQEVYRLHEKDQAAFERLVSFYQRVQPTQPKPNGPNN